MAEVATSPRIPGREPVFRHLDDPDVPPQNTLEFFTALRGARVPVEMHLFEKGGHGFGIAAKGDPAWPELFLKWGAGHGYFRGM